MHMRSERLLDRQHIYRQVGRQNGVIDMQAEGQAGRQAYKKTGRQVVLKQAQSRQAVIQVDM